MVNELHVVFAQEVVWEGVSGSSFTAGDPSVIATALERLSRTVPRSGTDFTSHFKGLVDEREASQVASAESEREVEPQMELFSEAKKVREHAFNNSASFYERAAATSVCAS